MKIVLIPDKFKGSATADEVSRAIIKGILKVQPHAEFLRVKASDGGDGFLNAVENYTTADRIYVETTDPIGRPINAYYLLQETKKTAYFELAMASGIALLSNTDMNVMESSTLGTGIQIRDAIKKGVKTIVLGLGGSATNDGGVGIAHALGYEFLDYKGNKLTPIGKNLSQISEIIKSEDPLLNDVSFLTVNDVTNPLFGPKGAAYVYAEQKGADSKQLEELDMGLRNLDNVVKTSLGFHKALEPGTGAAGGTAFGLKVFFNAEFINGVDFLFNLAELHNVLKETTIDLIITGEGKIDDQTLHGKLIKGVLDIGLEYNIPVIAVCGKLELGPNELMNKGLYDVLEIMDPTKSVQYSIDNAPLLIEKNIIEYFEKQNKLKS